MKTIGIKAKKQDDTPFSKEEKILFLMLAVVATIFLIYYYSLCLLFCKMTLKSLIDMHLPQEVSSGVLPGKEN